MAVKFLNAKFVKSWQLSLLVSVIAVAAVMAYFPNYSKLKDLRNENERLIFENEQLEKEIADLEQKIEGIGKDYFLYEKIARDSLGVAKEDEIVIDIGQ